MNRERPLLPAGLLISGFLLLALASSAQLLPIRNYATKEGLSSNNIYAVLRDTRGILWVGTSNGVNCYDGNRFFSPRMDHRSGQTYVTNLLEDHEHNVWVTSWYNGLYKYQDGRFHNYLPDSAHLEAQANNTFDLLEWRPGRYLVATDKNVWAFDDAGASSVGPSSAQPVFHLFDPTNPTLDVQIGSIAQTSEGDVLIGYSKGVARYRQTGAGAHTKWTYAGMLWAGSYVDKIVVAGDECWLGTDKGLYYFPHLSDARQDTAHNHPVLLYSGAEVDKVYADAKKNIWFTAGAGAHKLSAGSPIRNYTRSNGLPSNMVRAFCTDAEGVTWLGTQDGLARLGQEYYHFYPIHERGAATTSPQDEDNIITIHTDEHDCLWLGSYTSLYHIKKGMPASATEYNTVGKDKTGFIHCMVRDKDGHLWAATDAGVLLIEGDRPVRKHRLIAHSAFADPDGRIWFGGRDGTVFYERADTFHQLAYYNPTKERIDAIFRQGSDTLWLGHSRLGLKKFRLAGDSLQLLQEYTGRTGYHNLRIRSLTTDGKGHLLAGTRTDGLYIFSLDSETQPLHITETDGLCGNWVKAATIGREGIYLVTDKGLTLLEAESDYHNARLHCIPFRNEQMLSEFNTLYLQSDTLWLGTAKGLLQYMPRRQEKNSSPPPAYFMKLTINGRTDSSFRPFTSNGVLPAFSYSQNNLAFDFAGLSFRDEDNVRYRYKMEGLDKDWSPLTDRRYVNYTHLSPGKYRLLVMARNDDQVWTSNPAALSFRISAPFWLQGWFITLCTASLVALVYLFYRYRLRQALKIERLRTKISTDLHDDIGSTLSSISIMSDMIMRSPAGQHPTPIPTSAEQQPTDTPPPAGQQPIPGPPTTERQHLTNPPTTEQQPRPILPTADWQRMAGEIKENSLSLMDKMDDIVWSINPRNDEVENLMARIQRFAAPLLEAKGIDYEILIENNIRHLKLSMEHRQHIYLIMKEAITNLVKYSGAGKALIRALPAGGSLKVEVCDDGKGFLAGGKAIGNGIVNMKSRAELMRALLHIDSAPGKGTTVILTLKIN